MEKVGSVKLQLEELFLESLRSTAPDEAARVKPIIISCKDKKIGDFQCNNANGLFKKVKKQYEDVESVGEAIKDNLPVSDVIQSCSISGNIARSCCFINVVLSGPWMAKRILNMLKDGIETWGPRVPPVKRAVVDFSSPNIAKEMRVGHLRSTIIGDSLAHLLEFSGVQVLTRNHVGDWGTQFGMLIEHLFDNISNWEHTAGSQPIEDLEKRFNSDDAFKARAQRAVVDLQAGDDMYRKAWTQICQTSRNEFQKVYQRLNVDLEEKGESFYNSYIPKVLEQLTENGFLVDDEENGGQVILIKGFKNREGKEKYFLVVKKDGGYNYSTTDLTALWYRLNEEKTEWIIYLTDVGQSVHFAILFAAARLVGWLPPAGKSESYPKVTHVGFSLVLTEDGKRFRTSSTEAAEWTEEELEQTAEAVGYADLKNNISTDYTCNFDQMLNDRGNTAVYLLYAHARICSIIRKSGKDIEELKQVGTLTLDHPDEHRLGVHMVQFPEVIEEACARLHPNVVCEYLYDLSQHFTTFYTNCQVNGSAEEEGRLLLCEATAVVMRKCFQLLGITPVYKM